MNTKAKCRHLKNWPVRDFAAGVYLSEAPSPPMTLSPPLHNVYVYTVYLYLYTQGGGELTREKVRGATVHKAG
jgi:hypothetical protein